MSLQEKVERGEPLRQTLFDLGPFVLGNDARHQIVGEDAFGAFLVAVNGEGDAFVEEREVGGLLGAAQFLGREAQKRLMRAR